MINCLVKIDKYFLNKKKKMLNRKYFKLIFFLSFIILSCLVVAQTQENNSIQIDKTNIIKQLSIPSNWQFKDNIQTIGQAINEILKDTKLHLSSKLSTNIQDILKQQLLNRLRKLQSKTVFQAIKDLTGAQIFVITPHDNKISFSFDENLSTSKLTIKAIDSRVQQYLNNTDCNIRVTSPLIENGLSQSPTYKEILNYNKECALYFAFNEKQNIIAIATNQKEADALAQKDRQVYYALAGQTLKETIRRWANYNGYRLYYLAKRNLVINSSNVFFGKLTAQNGSLAQLIQAASQSGINIKAQFNTNYVLVIKDDSFSPLLLTGGNLNV